MTEQEAIERLECLKVFMQIEEKETGLKFLDEDYESNKMAITALKKQIPKKMKHSNERIPFSWYCPTCNEELSDDGYKYDDNHCFNCGQKLDLED